MFMGAFFHTFQAYRHTWEHASGPPRLHFYLTASNDMLTKTLWRPSGPASFLSGDLVPAPDERRSLSAPHNSPVLKSSSSYLSNGQARKRGSFQCRYCARSFTYLTPFIAHEEGHNREMRFRCYFCPEAFHSRQQLTVHLRRHKDEIMASDDGADNAATGQKPQPPL
ncbi:uncharacterized protein LOC144158227 isoform X2 [Haemaphysalis longicornis]